jgi:branched-subunit amino acid ABC-type transport system permease component
VCKPRDPERGDGLRAVQIVFVIEQVLNGLLAGAYYLLIALGLSLIFALGGIVNLAHGGFYAIGAYLAVILSPHIGFAGAFVVSPIAVGVIGIAVERSLFRRFYRSDPILSLLLTFGLAMVIEQGLRITFGATPLPFAIRRSCADRSSSAISSIRAIAWSSSASLSRRWWRPGSSSTAPRSGGWCGLACRTPMWSAHSASRSRLT